MTDLSVDVCPPWSPLFRPPVGGDFLTLTFSAVLDETVSSGSLLTDVSFDGFQVANHQGSFEELNISLPIPAGKIDFSAPFMVPAVPTNTTVQINLSAVDAAGEELLCISVEVEVVPGSRPTRPSGGQRPPRHGHGGQGMPPPPRFGGEGDFPPPRFGGEGEEGERRFPPRFGGEGEFGMPPRPTGDDDLNPGQVLQALAAAIPNLKLDELVQNIAQSFSKPLIDTTQLGASVPVPYTNCGASSDEIFISNITCSAWPPVLGTKSNLDINLVSRELISGGTYTASVSLNGFPIVNKSGDISKYFKLPIQPGPVTITKDLNIPNIGIHGAVGLKLSAQDSNGNELFCVSLTANV